MRSRRWLVTIAVGLALLLVVGRVLAGWYVDFTWYDALGAAAVWRLKMSNLALLRGGTFVAGTLFVFANLYAVRHSIRSLILPRRVGNLEIGEEVSERVLDAIVVVVALVIGTLLALPHDNWVSLELIRHGDPFGETDPYFQEDLSFWVYRLPLETSMHFWAMTSLVAITLVVVFLYALTPSLGWDNGKMHVSSHVRRHLFTLAAILLLLLAWSYRLDAYGLLLGGGGNVRAFSAIDHRVGIPAHLVLAVVALAGAMLVFWSGWSGHIRVAFFTISALLLTALVARQIIPPIASRFVTPADPELREGPYRAIRAGYTRRAFDVDRLTREGAMRDSAPAFADAVRGTSLWDGTALTRVIGRRSTAAPNGSLAWAEQDGRLVAYVVERPTGPEATDPQPTWGITRVAADVVDDRGAPLQRDDPEALDPNALRGVLVQDAADTYYVLADSGAHVLAPELHPFLTRAAFAWHLQNPRLLTAPPSAARMVILLRRDVRARIDALYPFFTQGTQLTPVVWRDSVFWAVHVYTASNWFPLSQQLHVGADTVRYLRHAALVLVNAETGRTTAIADPSPDAMTSTWMRRFPSLFSDPATVDVALARRIPPPRDGTLAMAEAFALVGVRGEFVTGMRLPAQSGGDSSFTLLTTPPFYDRSADRLAMSLPVLNGAERIRGMVTSEGGLDWRPRWRQLPEEGPRWSALTEQLERVTDSLRTTGRDVRLLQGAVRIVPTAGGYIAVQSHYLTTPDGRPEVLYASLFHNDSVRAGATLMAAAGVPIPSVREAPLTAEEFRNRVQLLYDNMRDALRQGDWIAFGAAYDALGRLLRMRR